MLHVKFLQKSLLISTFLVSVSTANAMYAEEEYIDEKNGRGKLSRSTFKESTIGTSAYHGGPEQEYIDENNRKARLTLSTLKKGHERGYLELEDGSKYEVIKRISSSLPYGKVMLDSSSLEGAAIWSYQLKRWLKEFTFMYIDEDSIQSDFTVRPAITKKVEGKAFDISSGNAIEPPIYYDSIFGESEKISTYAYPRRLGAPNPGEYMDENSHKASLCRSTLKKGYKRGYLELEDGSKYEVINGDSLSEPLFDVTEQFDFYRVECSGLWSHQLKQWIQGFKFTCFEGPPQAETVKFDLLVKPFTEDSIKKFVVNELNKESSSIFLSENIIPPMPSANLSQQSSKIDINETIKIKEKLNPQNQNNSYKIFIEPNSIETKDDKNFHMIPDLENGLFYGIELLTPENVKWWYARLGFEAQMGRGKVKFEPEENILINEGPFNEGNIEISNAISDVFGVSSSSNAPSFSDEVQGFCQLINYMQPFVFDEEYERVLDRQIYSLSYDYLGAWRGFEHNLDNSSHTQTWVAYVSSKFMETPLSQTMKPTSPDIKMAMTLQMGKAFYSPLGIYSSLIARAFDKEAENKHLSVPFHSAVARLVKTINPALKYMVVRPLKSMKGIFGKSGLEFSESNGRAQSIEKPYIRCTTAYPGRLYDIPVRLTDAEKEEFGNSPYILIDPRTDEFHRISHNHWFVKNPFLGRVSRDLFEAFPFVTMDIESLGNFASDLKITEVRHDQHS